MFSLINFKSKPFVGLDISRDEVRLLALKATSRSGVWVTAAGMEELPDGVIHDGRIKDPERLQKELSGLVQKWGVVSCPTAIALPHSYVMNRQIQFQTILTDLECDKEIAMNLTHYLPGVSEEVCYDFERLDDQENQIALVAARKDLIYEYINVVNQSGLIVSVIDVDSCAWTRAIDYAYSSAVIGILEIHDQSAQLSVYHKNHPNFSQSISMIDSEFIHELKLAIQMYSLTFCPPELTGLLIVGKQLAFSLIERIKIECNIHILDANFFPRFMISPSCYSETLNNLAPRMWVSLGLALRGNSL